MLTIKQALKDCSRVWHLAASKRGEIVSRKHQAAGELNIKHIFACSMCQFTGDHKLMPCEEWCPMKSLWPNGCYSAQSVYQTEKPNTTAACNEIAEFSDYALTVYNRMKKTGDIRTDIKHLQELTSDKHRFKCLMKKVNGKFVYTNSLEDSLYGCYYLWTKISKLKYTSGMGRNIGQIKCEVWDKYFGMPMWGNCPACEYDRSRYTQYCNTCPLNGLWGNSRLACIKASSPFRKLIDTTSEGEFRAYATKIAEYAFKCFVVTQKNKGMPEAELLRLVQAVPK